MAVSRRHITITGVVQGVGFRPFVYGLATRLGLAGWVLNTSAGVEIEVEGPRQEVERFLELLPVELPPLARVERIDDTPREPEGAGGFEIRRSLEEPGAFQPVSPDVATCPDCRRELLDPEDRRYRYPFTNCTNCGPRFTIIRALPYDRPQTTMAPFVMCPTCRAEYDDPANRRFHAQPNACPDCGPHVWLEINGQVIAEHDDAVTQARRMLAAGRILGIKGLGGFHLACDATTDEPVEELRRRKGRVDKPFALMAYDSDIVERYCTVSPGERGLLETVERPIVLLTKRPDAAISHHVAPGIRHLGFMLPYTPLHMLLLQPAPRYPDALVMTSGNYAEEPIVVANEEARSALGSLTDGLLLHDRKIHVRCDDSVVRMFRDRELPLRRSRGYAPFPVHLPFEAAPILACGAELKNTFCLTREGYAFLSQHIGDMENYETLRSYEQMVEHFRSLYQVDPRVAAYDLHPDYLATRYALGSSTAGWTRIGVQHHHAHIASCMCEHGMPEDARVLGLSFDGTGYGTDATVWGGEVLLAGYSGFERVAHLRPVPLPGADAAVRKPFRMALSWLRAAGLPWDPDLAPVAHATPAERQVVEGQVEGRLPTAITSSMGRLFDAVAALAGVRQTVTYEAQAAIELEALIDPNETGRYQFDLRARGGQEALVIDPGSAVRQVVADVRDAVPTGVVSARFHNGLAAAAVEVCETVGGTTPLNEVVLSGGVFQNLSLLERLVGRLEARGFRVYWHTQVPPNDGGLALGQAVVAAARLRDGAGGADSSE